jgi:hypothetical protein
MKTKLILIFSIFGFLMTCFGQQNSTWDKWNWLIGEWVGEGSGQTGQGSGAFSMKPDLDNKILIRKNHSEYPANEKRPQIIHDDLMIVYLDILGSPSKAIYFDNEGHIINYNITYSEKTIVLTSDKTNNLPIFRLTYTLLDNDTINVKFEMSQDGEKFSIYTQGICKKVK